MAALGGISQAEGSANSVEFENLARFAVDEHNKKENALLQFKKVTNVKQQVVSGTLISSLLAMPPLPLEVTGDYRGKGDQDTDGAFMRHLVHTPVRASAWAVPRMESPASASQLVLMVVGHQGSVGAGGSHP
ncbi:hypothetical protein V6N13_095580 [Hibiscus sabdariffa]|uniref:Cysteine proteinase inhibitor n=1 Tax=Hibiscus sabdariffa TaxID=183260 RepID=A0ABR2PRA8_9ROSI